jgi:hypothetical protein
MFSKRHGQARSTRHRRSGIEIDAQSGIGVCVHRGIGDKLIVEGCCHAAQVPVMELEAVFPADIEAFRVVR